MVKRVELNRILDFSVGIQMIIALLAVQCKLNLEESLRESRGWFGETRLARPAATPEQVTFRCSVFCILYSNFRHRRPWSVSAWLRIAPALSIDFLPDKNYRASQPIDPAVARPGTRLETRRLQRSPLSERVSHFHLH